MAEIFNFLITETIQLIGTGEAKSYYSTSEDKLKYVIDDEEYHGSRNPTLFTEGEKIEIKKSEEHYDIKVDVILHEKSKKLDDTSEREKRKLTKRAKFIRLLSHAAASIY